MNLKLSIYISKVRTLFILISEILPIYFISKSSRVFFLVLDIYSVKHYETII